jgi:chitin disaccharide deacetylase
MEKNPFLRARGYAEDDRLLIIHVDDVGMCQASTQAFIDLWEAGSVSSGSVMMPCPWAPAVALYCRTHPGVDMGVHATLNAEWQSYRWGPLSTRDPSTGMMDAAGHFHRSPGETRAQARPDAVLEELRAQVRTALDWGIDVTHVDNHMNTVAHPRFISGFAQAAVERQVPVLIPRGNCATFGYAGGDAGIPGLMALIRGLEERGVPLIDEILEMPLRQPEHRVRTVIRMLEGIPAGITFFAFHPAIDSPELRAIAPDWRCRVADYEAFMGREIKAFLAAAGIRVIGYRDLREAMA